MRKGNLKILTVYYDFDLDDTTLRLTEDFENADSLTKLDILKEIIGALSIDYGVNLEKFRSEFRKD
jgi:hypothetical protein